MIVYELSCKSGHDFEGWYASPAAFERQRDAGHLECPACGTPHVRKRPSAPYVHTAAAAAPAKDRREQVLAELRALILSGTEDVGRQFAQVARRIHRGEEEGRAIRGRATAAEAVSLQEDGIDAVAVPPELRLDDTVH